MQKHALNTHFLKLNVLRWKISVTISRACSIQIKNKSKMEPTLYNYNNYYEYYDTYSDSSQDLGYTGLNKCQTN